MKTIVKFILICLVLPTTGCTDPTPPPRTPARPMEVIGLITEIEAGTMSLRTQDNKRQFIFSLENPPVATEYLQEKMDRLSPIRVTYRVEGGRLIPIAIEDA